MVKVMVDLHDLPDEVRQAAAYGFLLSFSGLRTFDLLMHEHYKWFASHLGFGFSSASVFKSGYAMLKLGLPALRIAVGRWKPDGTTGGPYECPLTTS